MDPARREVIPTPPAIPSLFINFVSFACLVRFGKEGGWAFLEECYIDQDVRLQWGWHVNADAIDTTSVASILLLKRLILDIGALYCIKVPAAMPWKQERWPAFIFGTVFWGCFAWVWMTSKDKDRGGHHRMKRYGWVLDDSLMGSCMKFTSKLWACQRKIDTEGSPTFLQCKMSQHCVAVMLNPNHHS